MAFFFAYADFAQARAMHKTRLSLLHIEDDPLWRDLIGASVATQTSIGRYLSAGTGEEGFRLAQEHAPEVVLLDLRLPDVDGLALAGELARLAYQPRTVLLTARSDEATLHAASLAYVAGSIYAARSQRQRIREKLGLRSTTELIHWAIRSGIVDPARLGRAVGGARKVKSRFSLREISCNGEFHAA
jgi:DNA-binding NarL/FixJ family response regulator